MELTLEEKKEALKMLDVSLAEAKAKIIKRRKELHAADLERRIKEFDRLPLEQRKAREAIGWSPYQDGEPIRRMCGTIAAK